MPIPGDRQTCTPAACEVRRASPKRPAGRVSGVGTPKRTRRSPAPGGRPFEVVVALSEWEMALVQSAAGRQGMATSAWLGEVGACEAARGSDDGDGMPAPPGAFLQRMMCARAELMDSRRVLRNVGGNLNDVARHANSTGRLAVETARVQALVARAVTRVDVAVADLAGLLAAAQRAQLLANRRAQRPGQR